jgi:putative spermidine/putrescine transport system permease protein
MPIAIYLVIFYVWPVANVLKLSLFDPGFSLNSYQRALETPVYVQTLVRTFEISLIAALVSLGLGYPTAYAMAAASSRMRAVMVLIVTAAYLSNVLVRNYAWIFMLADNGVVNSTLRELHWTHQPLDLMFNRFGLMVGMVHILLPTTILILLATMLTIGPEHLRAASSLAAGPFTAFRRAYLPRTMPAIVVSVVLVFVLASAFFTTPAMLGGSGDRMMSNIIVDEVENLNWGFAGALSIVLVVASIIVIFAAQRLVGGAALIDRGGSAGSVHMVTPREGSLTALLDRVADPIWPWVPPVVATLTMAYLVLPLLIVLPISLSRSSFISWPPDGLSLIWYQTYLTSPRWIAATVNSLEIASLTTVIALGLAIPAALGFVRSRSPLRPLIFAMMVAPLLIPNILTAIGVLLFFTPLDIYGNPVAVALGHVIEAAPLATLVLLATLRNLDPNLEKAAASLGAGPLRTLFRVTLPVLAAATVTAGLFAFMHSFNELLIALFVGGISATTLPKRMWESLQDFEPTITAVSTLLIVFAVLVFVALRALRADIGAVAGDPVTEA